ncbi:hypothetical protein [Pseudomonas sp. zjy_13]|uniref:hypothetical protein n=1 Tax=Pseudomonas sp. zjy_13 TaxID=3367263 RepID=UPI00370DA723
MESRRSAFIKCFFVVVFVIGPFGMGLYSNLASQKPLDVSQAIISVIGLMAGVYAIIVVQRRNTEKNSDGR